MLLLKDLRSWQKWLKPSCPWGLRRSWTAECGDLDENNCGELERLSGNWTAAFTTGAAKSNEGNLNRVHVKSDA